MIKKIIKENFIYIILLILLCISFVMLYNSVFYKYIIKFDYLVASHIPNIINNKLTIIFRLFTFLGEIYIPLLIIVCILLIKKNKLYFYIISSSYLFSGITTFVMKNIVLRPRPVDALIAIPKSYSFPSGHTLTSIVFYIILCYLLTMNSSVKNKFIIYLLIIITVILIGFSRIYLGVHYFSDVIGGMIIALMSVCLIINIIKKNYKEKL